MSKKEHQEKISDEIGKKEFRKQKSANEPRSVWYGFGLFGLVGWSVTIPTLIGVFVGLWFDRQMNHPYTCTITGLLLGLISGCWIAWNWIQREILTEDSELNNDDLMPINGESKSEKNDSLEETIK